MLSGEGVHTATHTGTNAFVAGVTGMNDSREGEKGVHNEVAPHRGDKHEEARGDPLEVANDGAKHSGVAMVVDVDCDSSGLTRDSGEVVTKVDNEKSVRPYCYTNASSAILFPSHGRSLPTPSPFLDCSLEQKMYSIYQLMS